MLQKRAYKYRFYPTPEQAEQLARTFGCARFIYNWGLQLRKEAWFERQEQIGYSNTAKQLAALKQAPETAWLSEVSSVVLQQSLRHLDTAFRNFFAKRGGYPTFKSKRRGGQSASYMANGFSFHDGQITLAKQDKPLDIRWSRQLPAEVKISSITVSKDAAGRYFASLLVEEDIQPLPETDKSIALDVGLKTFAMPHEGEPVANPKYLGTRLKRLARYQRSMARKLECAKVQVGLKGKGIPKGVRIPRSNNHQKAAAKVARLHASVNDARNDFLHQLSTRIVRENQVVAVEDLNVSGMIQNPKLARDISDASWSRFRSMLEYKCAWYGRQFVATDRWLPTSKRCSDCGYTLDELRLSVREWTCPACGAQHDRDRNAAKNILNAALATIKESTTAGLAGSYACQDAAPAAST